MNKTDHLKVRNKDKILKKVHIFIENHKLSPSNQHEHPFFNIFHTLNRTVH